MVDIAADSLLIENLLHVVAIIEQIEPVDSMLDVLRSLSQSHKDHRQNNRILKNIFVTEMTQNYTKKQKPQLSKRGQQRMQKGGNIGLGGLAMELPMFGDFFLSLSFFFC